MILHVGECVVIHLCVGMRFDLSLDYPIKRGRFARFWRWLRGANWRIARIDYVTGDIVLRRSW